MLSISLGVFLYVYFVLHCYSEIPYTVLSGAKLLGNWVSAYCRGVLEAESGTTWLWWGACCVGVGLEESLKRKFWWNWWIGVNVINKSISYQHPVLLSVLFLFTYWFLERNVDLLFHLSVHVLAVLLYVLWLGIEPTTSEHQGISSTNWATGPVLLNILYCCSLNICFILKDKVLHLVTIENIDWIICLMASQEMLGPKESQDLGWFSWFQIVAWEDVGELLNVICCVCSHCRSVVVLCV